MYFKLTPSRVLGVLVTLLAVLALLVWVPNDTVSGFVQSKRGRVSIGDAMAPALAFGLMALSGVLILWEERTAKTPGPSDRRGPTFVAVLLGICVGAFAIMIWAGPLAVAVFATDETYRNLRDAMPWKHIGFAIGGTGLVTALITLVESRFSWFALLIGVATVTVLIGVFDLAFDDLLLPPNGDQ
nr:hypothetical protein [Donghicola mangrovi]